MNIPADGVHDITNMVGLTFFVDGERLYRVAVGRTYTFTPCWVDFEAGSAAVLSCCC